MPLSVSWLSAHVNVWKILLSYSPLLTSLPLWYSPELSLAVTSSKKKILSDLLGTPSFIPLGTHSTPHFPLDSYFSIVF